MQEHRKGESSEELNQLISFLVGEEEYGLDILRVKEVIRIRQITRLPQSPTFVKGIINLRGDVIPIIDLRERFGLERRQYSKITRVIVVDLAGKLVGMVVDSASQVVRIPAESIEPPPPVAGRLSLQYIRGVGKLEDRLVILLNIDRILNDQEQEELVGISNGTAQPQAREAALSA